MPWQDAERVFSLDVLKQSARSPQSESNWRRLGVPSHVIVRLLRQRSPDLRAAEPFTAYRPNADLWLDPEWQATHTFTAMVYALRRLEKLPARGPQAWKTRVGWEAMMAGAKVLLAVAGWTDADWKELFERRADQWRRPKRGDRSEAETLSERLQIELL